ncbi:uncharacterized protein [Diabrotica undecimpunctata]|uniref:uncharacterized protein n=1 Tax=Diabrotica undecimpunctata TaxID=50387 RepID=UPI003B633ADB
MAYKLLVVLFVTLVYCTRLNLSADICDTTHPYPYPGDCRKFYVCTVNGLILQNCDPGKFFNPETYICDYTLRVDCAETTTEINPTKSDFSNFFSKFKTILSAATNQTNKQNGSIVENVDTSEIPTQATELPTTSSKIETINATIEKNTTTESNILNSTILIEKNLTTDIPKNETVSEISTTTLPNPTILPAPKRNDTNLSSFKKLNSFASKDDSKSHQNIYMNNPYFVYINNYNNFGSGRSALQPQVKNQRNKRLRYNGRRHRPASYLQIFGNFITNLFHTIRRSPVSNDYYDYDGDSGTDYPYYG